MIGASEQVFNEFYEKSSGSALEVCDKIHLEIAHLCIELRKLTKNIYQLLIKNKYLSHKIRKNGKDTYKGSGYYDKEISLECI